MSLNSVPAPVLDRIVHQLPLKALKYVSSTCKQFRCLLKPLIVKSILITPEKMRDCGHTTLQSLIVDVSCCVESLRWDIRLPELSPAPVDVFTWEPVDGMFNLNRVSVSLQCSVDPVKTKETLEAYIDSLQDLFKKAPNHRHLFLDWERRCTESLNSILMICNALEDLSISREMTFPGDEDVADDIYLTKHCCSLRCLKVSNPPLSSGLLFENLERLHLVNGDNLDENLLERFFERCAAPNLRELILEPMEESDSEHGIRIGLITTEIVGSIVQAYPKLERVTLKCMCDGDLSHLFDLLENMQRLEFDMDVVYEWRHVNGKRCRTRLDS